MSLRNFFFLFFIASFFSYAQIATDTITAYRYSQKADSLLGIRQPDNAINYYKKALPIYKKAQAWERVASCYNGLSACLRLKNENEESLEFAFTSLDVFSNNKLEIKEEKIRALICIGAAYRDLTKFDLASDYLNKATDLSKAQYGNKHFLTAHCYYHLGILLRSLSKYKPSEQNFLKARDIILNLENQEITLGKINYATATLYSNWGKPYKALAFYEDSMNITLKNKDKDPERLGYEYFGLAKHYSNLNLYDKALNHYKKALAIFKNSKDPTNYFFTFGNIGLMLTNLGEYQTSIEYLNKGLNLGLSFLKKDNIYIGISYWNIGYCYESREQYELAHEYYKKALDIHVKTFGNNHEDVAQLYMNLGSIYTSQKKYEKALVSHHTALKILKTIHKEKNNTIASSLLSISNVHFEKNQLDESLFYAKSALSILEDLYGKSNPLNVDAMHMIGSIYAQQNKFDAAKKLFDQSIKTLEKSTEQNSPKEFNPENYSNHKMIFMILKEKIKMYRNEYLQDHNISKLENSITAYQKLETLISYTRKIFQSHEDKVFFSKKAKNLYVNALKSHFLLFQKTKKYEDLVKIFVIAENSKSHTMKELLLDNKTKNELNIDQQIKEKEKEVKTKISFYKTKIKEALLSKKTDSIELSTLKNKLFNQHQIQDSITQTLEKNYPKYYNLKYKEETISIKKVQEQLDDHTTLLEFFTTDSSTYAFIISKNKAQVKKLNTPKLTEKVQQFQQNITKSTKTFTQTSYLLYQEIIAPLKDQFIGDQLVIIPDGSLWHLNFELLLTQPNNGQDPTQWNYLLKDYAISYANSATLLFDNYTNSLENSTNKKECLAFSFSGTTQNSVPSRSIDLTTLRSAAIDLPGSRKEIKTIANLVNGTYFYGEGASEQNFKKYADQYKILHLALHGEVDNTHPENSKLYFTKSNDSLEDNLLYSHELFALDLSSELAVLSACNTGSGKLATGEGIMSLGNAFQYAGVQSLLLTRWEVSDQTTPEIMKYFYTHLKKGKNKAQALRLAKLTYLQNASQENNHPYYWAGFYLIGNPGPISIQHSNYWYWILGITTLTFIVFFGSRYIKKQQS